MTKRKQEFVKNVNLVYKIMNNLRKKYNKEIVPALKKDLNLKNAMAVPRIDKVVLNVGVGKGLKDEKFIDNVESTLIRITGQKPVKTKARKSISAFKIREGMTVGLKVDLRGDRMYDFIEKLIKVSLPRVRDFQGLSLKSFDKQGNYTIGIKEHIIFPEIKADEVENLHGLEIIISTTAKDDESAKKLLLALGFPLKINNK